MIISTMNNILTKSYQYFTNIEIKTFVSPLTFFIMSTIDMSVHVAIGKDVREGLKN